MATSIAGLIERFYGVLWNRWNDAAVDETLSPDFRFRGSLGRETLLLVVAVPDGAQVRSCTTRLILTIRTADGTTFPDM